MQGREGGVGERILGEARQGLNRRWEMLYNPDIQRRAGEREESRYMLPNPNPYIPSVQLDQRVQPVKSDFQPVGSEQPQGTKAPNFGGGAGGYWTAPNVSYGGGAGAQSGADWAKANYSPELMKSISGMYGLLDKNLGNIPSTADIWRGGQPQSLADMYRGFMETDPRLEQMEYNRALSRLKGQTGTARRSLDTMAASRRGGAGAGGYQGGIDQINRALLSGTGEIATAQAMKNMADRERKQAELIGYTQGDITNQMGWLGGLTSAMGTDWQAKQQALGSKAGWAGQMIPFEQFNIQTPYNRAAAASAGSANLAMRKAQMENEENYRRRQEGMGWLDRLMGWQGQQAGQYYTGQGQYGGYQGQRGQNILGGYGPQWLPY